MIPGLTEAGSTAEAAHSDTRGSVCVSGVTFLKAPSPFRREASTGSKGPTQQQEWLQ